MHSHETKDKLAFWQNNNWEPELFISGGAIFVLMQLNEWLHRFSTLLFEQSGFFENILIFHFVITAIQALIFGFGLHLICRGFWVAMVGLSIAFPQDIRPEKLPQQEPFRSFIQKHLSSNRTFIEKLHHTAGLVFGLSVLSAWVILSIFTVLLALVPHTGLRYALGESWFLLLRLAAGFLLSAGLLYLLDFITFGWLKKQAGIARLYYRVYRFFSLLSLAFFYRTAYYTIATNIKRWKFDLYLLVFVSIAVLSTAYTYGGLIHWGNPLHYLHLQQNNEQIEARFYDNLRPEGALIELASIPSDIVDKPVVRLFVVRQGYIERLAGIDPKQANISTLARHYRVSLNGKACDALQWFYFTHPQTKEKGIATYIPLHALAPGLHTLAVHLPHLPNRFRQGYVQIPFYKSTPAEGQPKAQH
ncbi:hypothetical protein [Thermonema rossianum]|uniref:hypothetical protein n=1 Tax=Thermonema rossianum TaxID=55505 RepID=UPI0012F80C1E|nr:hypothetical protein [Thermonema rossianum]